MQNLFSSKVKSKYKPKRLAVKLNALGEQLVIRGHPWVFSKRIVKINDAAITGDLAIIFSKTKNKMIGLGLYDAKSDIRIKIIHASSEKVEVNTLFFKRKIQKAFQKREILFKSNTNSYRLLFGENDGFPGLIADVYANILVVKLYSEIWFPYLKSILEGLRTTSQANTVVIRLSRHLKDSNTHNFVDGEIVFGKLENETIHFVEHGVHFSANVIKGHKTGYFLDHRANRKQVGKWSKEKTVLDVFSYTGGFSVHALANKAKEVTSLDMSKHAINLALYNGKLNTYTGVHKILCGEAFRELKHLISNKKVFDVVVIDPPSFAKQQSEVNLAKKKYAQLAELGLKLTAKRGLLVLASCSSRIIAQSFFDVNAQVLNAQDRVYKLVLKTTHHVDHPITFKEGAYLKCAYYRFID